MPGFNPDNYVDVQERINAFWAKHPEGRILTYIESDRGDWQHCRFRADVYTGADDPRPAATGWAFELAGQAGANKTAHEENAETSAIGRALANLGFAKTREDRPSKQEMRKAAAATDTPMTAGGATQQQKERIRDLAMILSEWGPSIKLLEFRALKITGAPLKALTEQQADELIADMEREVNAI